MRIFGLIFLLSLNTFSEVCSHDENNFRCVKYVKNYDADTITFNIPDLHPLIGNQINIRVLGVDTPEIRTKDKCEKSKAKDAKLKVAKLLKAAKRIDLTNVKRGKYFRIVADVVIDGLSLQTYLLNNGLAYAYDGGAKKKTNWCRSNRAIASDNHK